MTSLAFGILHALNEHKTIEGTEEFARLLGSTKGRVFREALILCKNGMIFIEPSDGGRGRKTIYRDAGTILLVANSRTRS